MAIRVFEFPTTTKKVISEDFVNDVASGASAGTGTVTATSSDGTDVSSSRISGVSTSGTTVTFTWVNGGSDFEDYKVVVSLPTTGTVETLVRVLEVRLRDNPTD